jgi:alpha-beta hydrolase superfamily lysophospholipase
MIHTSLVHRFVFIFSFFSLLFLTGCSPKVTKTSNLEKGKSITDILTGKEIHAYTLTLTKGEHAKIVAFQKGVDLVLTGFTPGNEKIKEVDSPNGSFGPEMLEFEAGSDGLYRFEIKALDENAGRGEYSMQIGSILSPDEYAQRAVKFSPAQFNEMYGIFEMEDGRIITTSFSFDFGPMYSDSKNHRIGRLLPLSDGSFFSTSTLLDETHPILKMKYMRDESKNITGLEWTEQGGTTLRSKRMRPLRVEEVSFKNGDVTLKGILLLPERKGKYAVGVHAHGSGDALRHIGEFVTAFLTNNMGMLVFDKRGCGESTGDWHTSSFADLADDVLAGVNYLRTRQDVDSARIGITGVSQGGWIGSIATAKSSAVKYLIINTGSGVKVWENVVHENEGRMRDAQLSEEMIQRGNELSRTVGEMASNGEPFDKIHALYAEQEKQPWAQHCFPANMKRESPWWEWYKKNGNISSADYLKKINVPVLWLLAEKDWMVPSVVSENNLRTAFAQSGNKHATLKTIQGARHGLLKAKNGLKMEVFDSPLEFSGEYISILQSWIPANVTGR